MTAPFRLLPWLQVCRFPAVFTALADIVLGWMLARGGLSGEGAWQVFAYLLISSAGLYLSGMVLNDVFDVRQDARERPQRPIPSGAISRRGAALFGTGLMLTGGGVAWLAGPASGQVSILLSACILAYNGGLKQTPVGPVIMGSCRFLNVLLGASGGLTSLAGVFRHPQLWVAIGLGIYIAGVTWFARTEATVSRRSRLFGAMLVINFGLATLFAWCLQWTGGGEPLTSLFLLLVIGLTINRRLVAALADPRPVLVQVAVRTMILSVITLDAALIYVRGGNELIVPAITTVLLLLPSLLLGLWIKLT